MNCDEMKRRLTAYAAGELSDKKRDQGRAHLAACPDCRARLADLEETDRRLRNLLRAAEPAADLWPSIYRAMDAEPRRSAFRVSSRNALRGWTVGLAATAALIGGFVRERSPSIPSHPAPASHAAPLARESGIAEGYLMGAWRDPLADQASLGALVRASSEKAKGYAP